MDYGQDFFISHASADKSDYIQPLAECLSNRGVTFWLDSLEVSWGDRLSLKINEGLRQSRHVILCLSKAFFAKPWPMVELNAAFVSQTGKVDRRILPLILNDKDRILNQYPLIAGLVYREYSETPEVIADELAKLSMKRHTMTRDILHVVVESVHTGHLANILVQPRASIDWLAEQARKGAGLRDALDTGGFQDFPIRWILVDANTESEWREMNENERESLFAIVKTLEGIKVSFRSDDRLDQIGVYDNIIFHLYAVPNRFFPPPVLFA